MALSVAPQLTASEIPSEAPEEKSGGLLMHPHRYEAGEPVERLDSAEFRVRMVEADDPRQKVLDFAADEEVIPPPGRWRVWLEGPGWMSPWSDLIVVRGSKPVDRPAYVRPVRVVPAGRVGPIRVDLPGTDEVRLLAVEPDSTTGSVRLELTRRVRIGEWPEGGVQMPGGRVVAAVWRPAENRYLALSRPFEVQAGEEVSPRFEPPVDGTGHLVAYVSLPPYGAEHDVLQDLDLGLRLGDRETRADIEVPTRWGVYALWYDLPQGRAALRGSAGSLVATAEVRIEGGRVARVREIFVEREAEIRSPKSDAP